MSKSSVLSVIITGSATGLKKVFGETEDDAKGFGSKLGKVGAVAGVALGGIALAAAPALKSLGDELKIMGDKSATVFGDQLKPMQDWAKENNRALGLSKQATLDLATSMSDLLIPMGFTREAAAEQSKTMIGAAGALSAWSKGKFTAAEVSDIMTKAMLGETDGLKALGISISADEIAARLLAKGQKDLTGAALAQAKALATQELIMEKSTDAQTAWADGTMDATKKQNEAKAKAEEMKATLATALQPAFQFLTDLLVDKLIPAFEGFTGFLQEHKAVAILLAAVVGGIVVGAFVSWAIAAGTAAVATLAAVGPIVAVIAVAALLAAGILYAYQHFELFHDGVNTAWSILQTTFGWVSDHWPLLLAILTGPIGLAVLEIVRHWDAIKAGFVAVRDGIEATASSIYHAIVGPFQAAFDWILDKWNSSVGPVFDKIASVGGFIGDVGGKVGGAFKHIPGLATGGIAMASPGGTMIRVAEGGHDEAIVPLPGGWRSSGAGGGTVNNIDVTVVAPVGASPAAVGKELRKYLNEYERAGGRG